VPLAPLEGQLELVRPPAPGQLELVRNFLNTLDLERGTDALGSPEGLSAWLRENVPAAPVAGSRPGPDELARARALRDSLRALALRNNALAATCEPAPIEEASRRAAFALTVDPATGTSLLQPTAAGVDGALGRVVAALHGAMAEKSWPRLKACADETCAWIYYDHSKNGCSRWCSAETCGNRSKVKRYRARQAEAAK
jgi:predicted RNA-binding Zn ribbon-like protein